MLLSNDKLFLELVHCCLNRLIQHVLWKHYYRVLNRNFYWRTRQNADYRSWFLQCKVMKTVHGCNILAINSVSLCPFELYKTIWDTVLSLMSALGQLRMSINVSDKSYTVHWQGSSSAFCSTCSSTLASIQFMFPCQ